MYHRQKKVRKANLTKRQGICFLLVAEKGKRCLDGSLVDSSESSRPALNPSLDWLFGNALPVS